MRRVADRLSELLVSLAGSHHLVEGADLIAVWAGCAIEGGTDDVKPLWEGERVCLQQLEFMLVFLGE